MTREYAIQSRKPGGEWVMVNSSSYQSKSSVENDYYRLIADQSGEFNDDLRVSNIRDAQRIVDRYNAVKDLEYRIVAREPGEWFDPQADGSWWDD